MVSAISPASLAIWIAVARSSDTASCALPSSSLTSAWPSATAARALFELVEQHLQRQGFNADRADVDRGVCVHQSSPVSVTVEAPRCSGRDNAGPCPCTVARRSSVRRHLIFTTNRVMLPASFLWFLMTGQGKSERGGRAPCSTRRPAVAASQRSLVMLKQFQRVQHRPYGMWLCIMRQNPQIATSATSEVTWLPVTRGGWPVWVSYPPQR